MVQILNGPFSNNWSFENGPSKCLVFEWIRYSNVRYLSPDCIRMENWKLKIQVGDKLFSFSEPTGFTAPIDAQPQVDDLNLVKCQILIPNVIWVLAFIMELSVSQPRFRGTWLSEFKDMGCVNIL